jgi:hypothetical protein
MFEAMPVQPGGAAEDDDVWMRILTNAEYLKKDGTVHNKAFGGKKAIAPPIDQQPWSLEISGRLLSFVKEIEKESIAFCSPPMVFSGLIYQTVENLRSTANGTPRSLGCNTDVIYTPKAHDDAHSDFVAYSADLDHRHLIRDWLQDFIQCVPSDKCEVLEALRK